MDKIEKIKDWLKPYLKKDKVRDEHEEGFFHCAMLLNDFLDTLEEELPENLDEAAKEYLDKVFGKREHYHFNIDLFKAGAKWQKTQMMKKAVKGYVTLTLTGVLTVAATIKEGDNIGIGDKVRLIIVKGE